jgi:hypothetical protein
MVSKDSPFMYSAIISTNLQVHPSQASHLAGIIHITKCSGNWPAAPPFP